MLIDRQPTIFIPFHLPWDRPADYQRQTSMLLARHYPVFCVAEQEPVAILSVLMGWLRPTQQNRVLIRLRTSHPTTLFWLRPVRILPFQRIATVKALNTAITIWFVSLWWWLWSQRNKSSEVNPTKQSKQFFPAFRFRRPIIWIFDPQFVTLLAWLRGWLSLYDCVDYHRSAAPTQLKKNIAHWEEQLISQVDIFSVNSHALYAAHQRLRQPDLLTVQGFAASEYRATSRDTQRSAKDACRHPIIGFIGAINDRIDYQLLQTVATSHPEWQFVLQGKIETEQTLSDSAWIQQLNSLLKLPNVTHQPAVNRTQLLAVVRRWAVGIIPYQSKLLFNQFCFPMKLFEYFYAGLPVVSTPIDELTHYEQYVQIASSAKTFSQAIERYLTQPPSTQQKNKLRQLALSHSYEHKIRAIVEFANTHYNEPQR